MTPEDLFSNSPLTNREKLGIEIDEYLLAVKSSDFVEDPGISEAIEKIKEVMTTNEEVAKIYLLDLAVVYLTIESYLTGWLDGHAKGRKDMGSKL